MSTSRSAATATGAEATRSTTARRRRRFMVSECQIQHGTDVDGEQETLQVPELRVVAGELVEVEARLVDVVHLVRRFAEEVVRVADLPLFGGQIETDLAV